MSTAEDAHGLNALALALRGQLYSRATTDPVEYDRISRVWLGSTTASPAYIALVAGTADVKACVDWAREHRDIPIAVVGGGHSMSGRTHLKDGFSISFSRMRDVLVDPATKTAWVAAGALWGDVDAAGQIYGLHCPGGAVSHTGVAGLVLGGGYDPALSRAYGMACDNLLEAEVVLPSGAVVRASETENAELFWAIRGGGGSFGVVTHFKFRLFPVAEMYAGPIVFPAARAREILEFMVPFWKAAPNNLTVYCAFQSAPGAGRVIALVVWYHGEMGTDYSVPKQLLAPIRALSPLVDHCGPVSFATSHKFFDAALPHGIKAYAKSKSIHIDDMSSAMIDHLLANGVESRPEPGFLIVEHWGGVAQAGGPDVAYVRSDITFALVAMANWTSAESEKDNMIAWSRAVIARVVELATRPVLGYMNFNDFADVSELTGIGADTLRRLKQARSQFDPTHLLTNGHFGTNLDH